MTARGYRYEAGLRVRVSGLNGLGKRRCTCPIDTVVNKSHGRKVNK